MEDLAVRMLPDKDLIVTAARLRDQALELQLPLTTWERQFLDGVVEMFMRDAGITWKQRRACRRVVEKCMYVLRVRTSLRAALTGGAKSVPLTTAAPLPKELDTQTPECSKLSRAARREVVREWVRTRTQRRPNARRGAQ